MNKGTARIQEEIKDCRGNKRAFLGLMAAGLLFAIFPFFLQPLVLILAVLADQPVPGTSSLELLIWSLPIGIGVAIGGIVGAIYYDHKSKKLMGNLNSAEEKR